MSKTSCIQHRSKTPLIVLHQDYIDICNGSIPAALILKNLEYWTDIKIANDEQVNIENAIRAKEGLPLVIHDYWIYKTQKDFVQDSMGLIKDYQVREGLDTLLTLGYIEKRNNPRYKWDRTLQYKLNIEKIQNALTPENNDPIRYQQHMEDLPVTDQSSTDNEAIPEITTETTTEKKSRPQQKTQEKEEGPLTQALIRLCKINTDIMTKRQKETVMQTLAILIKNNISENDLIAFALFWKSTWHGKDNLPPTLNQVRECWGEFEEWAINQPKQRNGRVVVKIT